MKKKSFLCSLFFLFLLLNYCKADNTFPYSIEFSDYNEGGKLYVADSNFDDALFYFVKTNWVDANETVYFWTGLKRKNAKGVSVNNSFILDAIAYKKSLLLLLKENEQILISCFDTANTTPMPQLIDTASYDITPHNTHWIGKFSDSIYFVLISNKLYKLSINSKSDFRIKKLSDNIICALPIELYGEKFLAYVEDRKTIAMVNFLDENGQKNFVSRIYSTDSISLKQVNNYLLIINSSANQTASLLQFVDIKSKNIALSSWIKSKAKHIDFSQNDSNIYALIDSGGNYKLAQINIGDINKQEKWRLTNISENIFLPQRLIVDNEKIYIICKNALLIFNKNMKLILFDYFNFNKYINDDFDFTAYSDYLILSARTGSIVLKMNKNSFWFVYRQIDNTGSYILYIILSILLLLTYRIYRNQKRLLDAILDLPTSGFVFLVNQVGKLERVNEGGKAMLGITIKIPLRKQFLYYCKTEDTKKIAELIENGLITRLPFQRKINIIQNNNLQEWFCSLIPLTNIAGRFRGVVLSGIDITEELERKTITSWAQLAHDMQTNLSTIRLNAEQIETDSENNEQRKNKIIYQVTILMQRVRDIVTVGRDDRLDRTNVNSIEFCNEIRAEFDDDLFSNVVFDMNLSDFNFICDKPKMIRAVRNAVENGIKSMKGKAGIIRISCHKDIHNIYLSVKDSGEGMDDVTKQLILTPFYSTARKEGGQGIGTMIMQRVAELHGGKLIIESKKGEGTEITIQFPDFSRNIK